MKTSVLTAYIAVVLIWSTTPLGIVWSSESVHPTMAVLLRMLIAVILGLTIIQFRKIELPWHKTACQLYGYSGFGIFIGMLSTYLASSYLTSGVMSLVFGLAPIISGVLASKLLGEAKFTRIHQTALFISLAGLLIVFSDGLSLSLKNWPGIMLILLAVFAFSYSSVLVKSVHININPIATTVGALIFTLPFFTVAWLLLDGTLPIQQWQARSLWAILYLGIFGSLIGFVAYYFILQKLSATTVALVTLMTPVIALIIGALLNNEVISLKLSIGAICVILGLFIYLLGGQLLKKKSITPSI